MPELTNRGKYEAQLAEELASRFGIQEDEALALIRSGQLGELEGDNWWDKHGKRLRIAIIALLGLVYIGSAENFASQIALGLDPAQIAAAARTWAEQHAGQLISGLNQTSREQIRDLLSRSVAEQWDISELSNTLQDSFVFSPVRADMIAVTETTNAQMQGERIIVEQLARAGVDVRARWFTQADELVCPICQPRHGKYQGDGWWDIAPAHPRCRCYIEYVSTSTERVLGNG